MDFEGKTAFVTGAGNGIGLGLFWALAKRGVNVAMADIEAKALETALLSITAFGVQVITVQTDVSDP